VRWQQQQLVQAIVRTADGRPGRVEAAALAELVAEQPQLSRLLSSIAHSDLTDSNSSTPVTDAMRKAEQPREDDDEDDGEDEDDEDDGDDTEYDDDEDEEDDGNDDEQHHTN
jgi:ribonuclease E